MIQRCGLTAPRELRQNPSGAPVVLGQVGKRRGQAPPRDTSPIGVQLEARCGGDWPLPQYFDIERPGCVRLSTAMTFESKRAIRSHDQRTMLHILTFGSSDVHRNCGGYM